MKKLKRALKQSKQRLSGNLRVLLFIVGFAAIGVILVMISRAAVPTASIESEKGVLNGNATAVTSVQASGGSYIKFNAPSGSTSGITVSGNQFKRDGKPWKPRGMDLEAILSLSTSDTISPKFCTRSDTQVRAWARNEIKFMDDWHVDTIRFQVSQTGLTQTNSSLVAAYVAKIQAAVDEARNFRSVNNPDGMVVILSLQDQSLGCGHVTTTGHGPSGAARDSQSNGNGAPLPSNDTLTAWRNLQSVYHGDPNIIVEVFNEPQGQPTALGWQQWRDGGLFDDTVVNQVDNYGDIPVGHQALVNLIRNTLHETNTILVDGLAHATRLDGIPTLTGGNIGYSVHPYFGGGNRLASVWDTRWGYLTKAATPRAVMITEWNIAAKADPCQVEDTRNHIECNTAAVNFIGSASAYLPAQQPNVGLIGWAFDTTGCHIVTNLTNWAPAPHEPWPVRGTGPSDWPQDASNDCIGSGDLIKSYFASLGSHF